MGLACVVAVASGRVEGSRGGGSKSPAHSRSSESRSIQREIIGLGSLRCSESRGARAMGAED
jgi:hypothetical protein